VAQPDGSLVPGVAQGGIQEGDDEAHTIRRAVEGRALRAFRSKHTDALATIGRAAAVAELGRVKLSGFFAWVFWLALHFFFLIGFRNRLIGFLQWVWAF